MIRNIRLDFGTNLNPDSDPDRGTIFPLFHHSETIMEF